MRINPLTAAFAAIALSASTARAQGIPHAEIVLDDSYILGVRAWVDQQEIETARWASTHASTKPVRDFAASLLRGHSNAQDAAKALADRMKVELKIPGDTDLAIRRRNDEVQQALHELKGPMFDRRFLIAIRDEHANEIAKAKGWYASVAATDSVKAYLRDIMPTLEKHKATAEKLLAAARPKTAAPK